MQGLPRVVRPTRDVSKYMWRHMITHFMSLQRVFMMQQSVRSSVSALRLPCHNVQIEFSC